MSETYITLAEAAERLGLSANTLRLQANRGSLKVERIGKRLLVTTPDEVERYRRENLGKRRGGAASGPRARKQLRDQDVTE